jgi:hypothetical protein
MLLDDTCFFVAADFDKRHWTEDSKSFLETWRRLNLPAALKRCRSGNGRARMVVLRIGHPGRTGPQTCFLLPDRNDGEPARYRPGFLRPILPVDVSGIAGRPNRPPRGRLKRSNGQVGCGAHPKPGAQGQVAIELDGEQHLSDLEDPDRVRNDRDNAFGHRQSKTSF